MLDRRFGLVALTSMLLSTVGCPEPGEEGDEGWAETGDTGEAGETGGNRGPGPGPGPGDDGGVETGGDVRPPLDTGDGDGDAGDDGGDGDPWDWEDRCWDRTWNGDALPAVILDNTIGRNDDVTGSCGLGPSPDFQLGFVAPWAGAFTFDTAGSSFDTVLIIDDGECGAPELGCNDDFINLESRVTVELDEAQIVTVTVDGTGPFEEGPLQLTITEATPPACASAKIVPNLPAQLLGDTTDGLDELASACGGEGAPERVFEFVAPGPGTYRFDTAGSAFDTVLYALDACDGPPLTCNDDANFELQSELTMELAGGQKLLIVVDGHGPADMGEFVLNVDEV